MKKALSDQKNPVFQRIADDAEAAGKLGVNSTPTFIVTAPGMSAKTVRANKIFELLGQADYKAILSGKK
jgi:protein-disulfide isomerase